MNKVLPLSALLMTLFMSNYALARDDKAMYSLEEALNTPEAKTRLASAIKLYFGNQSHPEVAKELGEWRTSKKTNGFNKSDGDACKWAFLTAAIELQERAKKEGGDAVINIKSNYKNEETMSDTQYMCGNGLLMTGVAFKGTVVKLK